MHQSPVSGDVLDAIGNGTIIGKLQGVAKAVRIPHDKQPNKTNVQANIGSPQEFDRTRSVIIYINSVMRESAQKRVVVSYARRDAARFATLLQQTLQPDCDVWLDTKRIEGGASWTVEIEDAIDNCDVLLALLTSGSYSSDICRAEQLRALRRGKRVIPLLVQRDADRPLHLETANYRDFTVIPPQTEQLQQLREDILTRHDAAALPKQFRQTYFTGMRSP